MTTWRFQAAVSHSISRTDHVPGASERLVKDTALPSRLEPLSHTAAANDDGPTVVTLDLAYAFANPLHAAVSATFFGQVSQLMVEAFENRCLDIYGPGTR
jgi:coenzyme Q-binding protein COQ10